MRFRYIYNIESVDKLVLKLLTLSKNIEYISILISNPKSLSSVPKEYVNYDLIAGVDKIDDLKCNLNVFDKFKKFYNQKDWMFGYLSYDLKNDIERLQSSNNDIIKSNKLSFFIPKYIFLLIGKRLEILSYEPKDKVDLFFSSLFVGEFTNKFQVNLKNRESKKKYLDKIVKIKEHIQRGDIYEMNYCTEFFAEKDSLDCESLFLNLNTIAKTPFSAFLKINEHTVISASPERFIKKKGNKLISQPIKGTISRGKGFDEDQAFAKKLKNSKKDISENIMITDLVRNDLSITALKNSVKVDELCEVYTFKKVHQMISTISSKVDNKLCFIELLKSVFPMGSMTGAPKLKAMELIEKYEEFKRGIFSGSVGYIMPNGDFDFNVIIRTILYNSYTKNLSVGVGGAITINSNPEKEYEECLVKLKPVLELLD